MNTHFLLFIRNWIIAWTILACVPIEIMHDGIEAELQRRGVAL